MLDQSRVVGGKYQNRNSGMVHHLGADHCRKVDKRVVVAIPPSMRVVGPRLATTPLPVLRLDAPADRAPVTQYLEVDSVIGSDAA